MVEYIGYGYGAAQSWRLDQPTFPLKLVNAPGIECKDVEKFQNINQNAMNEYYYNIL